MPVVKKRTTAIKKKKKVVKIIPAYLYYAPDCDYSRELLSILLDIPILAQSVKCVDVREYDVSGINSVPAIDDGISEEPHEEQEAFLWVIKQCYSLLESDDMVSSFFVIDCSKEHR
jgi:hypothetical protein